MGWNCCHRISILKQFIDAVEIRHIDFLETLHACRMSEQTHKIYTNINDFWTKHFNFYTYITHNIRIPKHKQRERERNQAKIATIIREIDIRANRSQINYYYVIFNDLLSLNQINEWMSEWVNETEVISDGMCIYCIRIFRVWIFANFKAFNNHTFIQVKIQIYIETNVPECSVEQICVLKMLNVIWKFD